MAYRTVISLLTVAVILVTSQWATAASDKDQINALYSELVELLKSDRSSVKSVTQLVEAKRNVAEKLLDVVKEKSQSDPKLKDAFGHLKDRLEDGLMLSEKRCREDVADKLLARAQHKAGLSADDRVFILERLTQTCPKRADALGVLGEFYLGQLQYGMAIETLKKKQKIQSDKDTEEMIALAQQRLAQYKQVDKIDPSEVRSLMAEPTTLMAPIPGKLGTGVLMRRALQTKVHFETLSSDIKEEFKGQLETVGKEVKEAFDKNRNVALLIEGHTDNRGGEQMNIDLSKKRADSVKSYLIQHFGIDPSRVQTKGYGFLRLLTPGTGEETHSLNRRVEFKKIELQKPERMGESSSEARKPDTKTDGGKQSLELE